MKAGHSLSMARKKGGSLVAAPGTQNGFTKTSSSTPSSSPAINVHPAILQATNQTPFVHRHVQAFCAKF